MGLYSRNSSPLKHILLSFAVAFPAVAAQSDSAFLTRYCITCHNEQLKTAGFVLNRSLIENAQSGDVASAAPVWEKVALRLHAGTMPPPGALRPEPAAALAVARSLESSLDRVWKTKPDPGRKEALHRLNRSEYRNVIRDLLDLEIDPSTLLPADDSSYGFDNVAGVLRLSPVLMERYTGAAQKISRVALGSRSTPATEDTFRVPSDLSQEDHLEGLPLGTRGGIRVRYTFALDAEYSFRVRLARDYVDSLSTFIESHQIEVSVDGERIRLFTIGEKPAPGATPAQIRQMNRQDADAGFVVRVPVKAGPRTVTVAFLRKTSALLESPRHMFLRPAFGAGGDTRLLPYIASVSIAGPFNPTGPGDTPSRERILTCSPTGVGDEQRCARQILAGLARRAYRRPVAEADLAPLLKFYGDGSREGGFEAGIELALRRLLVSPAFLFRIERDPPQVPANTPYRLGGMELASRLSFFLWSSIPDDELLNVAGQGKLSDPVILEKQVRRMLHDSRSESLVSNFAGQWLYLRNLPDKQPDSEVFPEFDGALRDAFRRETELFFSGLLHGKESATELLSANYTFLNERLARHYGIQGVYGDKFRRVNLPDRTRGGLLGQGSILLVTSNANRTSPVVRGKWLLENLLGAAPPPPPPNVPSLKENTETAKPLSVRERIEEHRANPACASCHTLMDPLGFALENFDAVGQWRTVSEAGTPIDAAGVLTNGTKVAGPADLRQALLSQPENFIHTLAEKLLLYALGRGLESYDGPAIRQIMREAERSNSSISALILAIVKSVPFQMRKSQS